MTNGDDFAGSDNPVPADSVTSPDTGDSPAVVVSPPAQETPSTSAATDAADTSNADPVLQETLKAYDQHRKQQDDAQAYYQNMRQQIADINQRLAAMPTPAPPEHIPIPALPDQQQSQQRTVGTILGQGLIIGGILSVVFGRSHNQWANAALYSGMGSFIDGFTKAQKERGTEQLQNWNKSVEYAVKMNQEADRTYNQVLANKRLDMTQQMDILRSIAAQRQDVEMYRAATSKDLDQVIRVIEQHGKANSAIMRAQIDVGSRAINQWLKSKEGNSWSMHVIEQSKKDGDPIDPTRDRDSLVKAWNKYSPTEWMETHTAGGAAKKQKGVSFEAFNKEAIAALGMDSVDKWKGVLDGTQQPIRGAFDKDGNWHNDPKGSLYATPDSGAGQSHGGILGIGETTNPDKKDTEQVKTIDQLRQLRERVTAGGSTEEEKAAADTGAVKTTVSGEVLKIQVPLTPDQARAKVASGDLKPGDWFQGTNGKNYQVSPQ